MMKNELTNVQCLLILAVLAFLVALVKGFIG